MCIIEKFNILFECSCKYVYNSNMDIHTATNLTHVYCGLYALQYLGVNTESCYLADNRGYSVHLSLEIYDS